MAYSSYQLPEFRKMKQNTRSRISSMHEMLLVVFKVGLQNGAGGGDSHGLSPPRDGSPMWLALDPSTGSYGVNLAQAHPEHHGL